MSIKTSIKVSTQAIIFLKNLSKNRIKTDVDNEGLSYWKLFDLIVKYFKNNNEQYLDLVKLKENNNA